MSTPSEGLRSQSDLLTAPAMPVGWAQLEAEIPLLRCAARQWSANDADAHELVQETLIRALASAHLWGGGMDLSAWLLTLMRSQAIATGNLIPLAAD